MSTNELSNLASEGGSTIIKKLDKDILSLKEQVSIVYPCIFLYILSAMLCILFCIPLYIFVYLCVCAQIQVSKQELTDIREQITMGDATIERLRPVNVSVFDTRAFYY